MRRTLLTFLAAAGLVVVPLGAAENTYGDAAGDSGTAPDITSVTVSNTDEGVVTFRVAANLVPNSGLVTYLETDLNPSTKPYGVVVVMPPGGSLVTGALDPNGAPLPIAIGATASGGVVQYSFPKEPFAINEAFAFWLGSVDLTEGSEGFDMAPEGDLVWMYVMTKPAPPPPPPPPVTVKPVIGNAAAAPARPVAGKRFVVTIPVTRSDDGEPLTTGTLACTTKAGGKVVAHRHTFKAGTARVTLTVPKVAKGKQLTVAVKVTADKSSTRVFTFKIR